MDPETLQTLGSLSRNWASPLSVVARTGTCTSRQDMPAENRVTLQPPNRPRATHTNSTETIKPMHVYARACTALLFLSLSLRSSCRSAWWVTTSGRPPAIPACRRAAFRRARCLTTPSMRWACRRIHCAGQECALSLQIRTRIPRISSCRSPHLCLRRQLHIPYPQA